MAKSKKLLPAQSQQASFAARRFSIVTFCKNRKEVELACEAAGEILIVDGGGKPLAVMRHDRHHRKPAYEMTAAHLDHHADFIVGAAAMGEEFTWDATFANHHFFLSPVAKRIPTLPRLDQTPRRGGMRRNLRAGTLLSTASEIVTPIFSRAV